MYTISRIVTVFETYPFLQGTFQVPHLQRLEHMFSALHGHPHLVFSFLFVAHELLQLQLVSCSRAAKLAKSAPKKVRWHFRVRSW